MHFHSPAFIGAVSILLGCNVAQASSLEIQGLASEPSSVDQVNLVTTTGLGLSGHAQRVVPNAGASQFAAGAAYGLLRVLSGAEGEFGYGTSWVAQGGALWRDTFQINPRDPTLLGTAGSFTHMTSVGGSGGTLLLQPFTDWTAGSSWNVGITFVTLTSLNNVSDGAQGLWQGSPRSGHSYSGDPPGSALIVTVDFIFGETILIEGSLSTHAGVQIWGVQQGRVEAYADFTNTVTSAGFTELRDAQGQLLSVADYSVVSESGTDWSRAYAPPVPEPASWLLLVFGGLIGRWWFRKGGAPLGDARSGVAKTCRKLAI